MTCRKRGEVGEVVYKKAGAGFFEADGSFGVLGDEGIDENGVCDDYGLPGHEDCVEWNAVRLVKANSFDEAIEAAKRGEFTGTARSVSVCEMLFLDRGETGGRFSESAKRSLKKALEAQLAALDAFYKVGEIIEPAYSALHRSAALLAIDCGDWREAKRLALKALMEGDSPDPATIRALRQILKEANEEVGVTTVYIGFQDWNRGGLHDDEYNKVEVPELNETTVKDAAAELVQNGYGYFYSVDMMPEDEKESGGVEAVVSERYWVHAETCPEGAARYNQMRELCDCDLNERFGGDVDVKVMEVAE